MVIWRNLDSQTLGRLLAHAAEARAAEQSVRRRNRIRQAAPADRPGQSPARVFSNTTWRSSKPQRS